MRHPCRLTSMQMDSLQSLWNSVKLLHVLFLVLIKPVIFSSNLLFSFSISVYRSMSLTILFHLAIIRLTFLDLVPFRSIDYHLYGRDPSCANWTSWHTSRDLPLSILEPVLQPLMLQAIPLVIKVLVWNWNSSVHLFYVLRLWNINYKCHY